MTTTTTATGPVFAPSAPAHIVADPTSLAYIREQWTLVKRRLAEEGPVLAVEVVTHATTNPACDSNCYEANTWGGIRIAISVWSEPYKAVHTLAVPLLSGSIERDAHRKLPFGDAAKAMTAWLETQVDAVCEFADEVLADARDQVSPLSLIESLRPRAIQALVEQATATLNGRQIAKNDTVEVFKGRKVPVGTKGVVKWIGTNHYGTSVGILVPGKDGLVFTAYGNCRRQDASQADIIAEAKRLYLASGYDKVFGAPRA